MTPANLTFMMFLTMFFSITASLFSTKALSVSLSIFYLSAIGALIKIYSPWVRVPVITAGVGDYDKICMKFGCPGWILVTGLAAIGAGTGVGVV